MTNLDIIKDNYASMSDEKLIQIAIEERHELTPEAFVIMKNEFHKRKLNPDIFLDPKIDEENSSPDDSLNSFSNTDSSVIGVSYQDMMYKDISKELNENKEAFMAKLNERDLNNLIKKCDSSMWKNGLVFVIGFGVTFITYIAATSSNSGGSYFVAWGGILFGAIGFFKAYESKTKFEAALKDIQSVKKEDNDETSIL